jgi:hypothetical protein
MRSFLRLMRALLARPSGEISVEQMSALFRQMPIALAVNTVNAVITAAVLQQLVAVTLPLGWLCVVLLVTSGRCALWLRHRGMHSEVADVAHWSRLATCGSLLAGMCWGLDGMVLFPIPRSIDLNRLVVGMEDLLRRILGDRIRVVITADTDLAPAHVDANQLELAILNLAINARDAMPDGGLLRIVLQNRNIDRNSPPELSPGGYVVVSIGDTGTGMDETILAQASNLFYTTKEIGEEQ